MGERHAPELVVTSETLTDAEIVMPIGDVDLSGSPILRHELRKSQAKRPARIIVDLAQVGYMDSTGLATLVEAMQQGRRNSTRIVLCSLTDRVRSIIEIARLDSVFVIAADREAARKA